MQAKFVTRLFVLWLLTLSISAFGQDKQKKPTHDLTEEQILLLSSKARNQPPSGPNFYIAPIQGTTTFSMLVSDGSRTVSDSFTLQQIEVYEAVLLAAKAFAVNDEKVGGGTPVITRLMDEHERAFFVDVSKVGNQSRVYVTLDTVTGKVTAPAGEIIRGSKKEPTALFLTMISQLQQARASIKPLQ